ncbi:regulatory protein, luxR family [Nonomuraea jiangxiensis]|uniref:Regulatory protein, luxR family n=2 Tax=Nonomuraea jiangxiensis TaxID=633440 RepID=A0A1G9AX08_9ACTN|nr:regulatory protein, luxR family [Nonomuraea jiangxiensis]
MRGWPFVGRDAELASARACGSGEAIGVIIAAEAGVGKTRLAREILAGFEADGWHTGWVGATRALASIPFGAVAGLLPADRLPEEPGPSVLSLAADHVRARGARVALCFDDAHLLDRGSAAVLGHLAAHGLAFPVVTIRGDEPVPDVVTTLWKDGPARWIDLDPLPPAAVDQLIEHELPGGVEGVTRTQLHGIAAGNPLALRELLSGALADGTLRRTYGVWHFTGDYRPRGGIRQLLADRLHPLDPPTRLVLELLACGEPLPLAMLERLTDAASIEAAEGRGLAVSERAGERVLVRLAHPLYGELLRAGLSAGRARLLGSRLAGAALATPQRRRDDALRAGLWQVESGTVTRPDIVRVGARKAIDRADLALAERLARAARDAEPGIGADALLAEVLEYRGRSAEAAEVLSEVPPPGPERVRWALARSDTSYFGAGDVVAAEQALDLVAGGPGGDLAEGNRSWILMFDGRCSTAIETARRLLAWESANVQAVMWAAAAATASAGFLGRPAEMTYFYDRGHALAQAHVEEFPWSAVQLGIARCLGCLALGDLVTAWDVAEEGYRRTLSGPAPLMSAGWVGFRGLVECAQGRPVTAATSLGEAVTALKERDTVRLTGAFMAGLATANALSGDHAAARAWSDRAAQAANGANRLFAPWAVLGEAWARAAAGTLSDAVAAARESAALARDIDLPAVEARALYDVARLGYGAEPARMEELGERLGTPFVRALATAARGLAGMDGDALSAAATVFTGLGHPLLAAEAATTAARAYRRSGLTGKSALAMERAAALRGHCEGATTPLLDHGGTAVLTRREREVALLAAHHSSKHIAARLGLSVATVNNNLARVYAKLGISNRGQLAALVDGDGPLE